MEKTSRIKEKAEAIAKDIYISMLKAGKPAHFNIFGSSMYPFLKGNDSVKVVPADENEIVIGDVVVVDNRDEEKAWFYAHRVVKIYAEEKKKLFVTKGDAFNRGFDKPVEFNRILGKVTEIRRSGMTLDFERPLWRRMNPRIGRLSLNYPDFLRFIAPYINLIVEWRRFPSKTIRRLRGIDPVKRNTEELLFILTQRQSDEGFVEKAQEILEKGVNWLFFMDIVLQNGMHHLFYMSLKKIGYLRAIPERILVELKKRYFYATLKAAAQHKETQGLLRLFSEKGISVMPLKGTFLSRRLYGDVASRGASSDIDLLVREKDIDSAATLLKETGYKFCPDSKVETARLWGYVYRKPNATGIDLHKSVSGQVFEKEKIKEFWDGTCEKEEDDISFREFREEELLLYLSLHFVDSTYLMSLRHIADINALLSQHGKTLDWPGIVGKAERYGLTSSLYVTLDLCRELFGAHVPDEVWSEISPGFIKRLFIRTFANKRVLLYRDSRRKRFMMSFLWHLLFQLLELRSLKDCVRIVLPPKGRMGIRKRSPLVRLAEGIARFTRALK